MAERKEISRQEIEVFRVLRNHRDEWITNSQIAKEAERVAPRTVRATTNKFVRLGLVDQAEVFPAWRYHISAGQRGGDYVDQLTRAAEIFGVKIS